MNVDLTGCCGDMENCSKVCNYWIFFALKNLCSKAHSLFIFISVKQQYILMHHIKEGLHIVGTVTNFTIPDNKDQLYVIDEVIEKVYFSKSRVMDYYLKLQDISRKVQKYSPTNEKPLEASPSKRKSARLQESSILHYSLH
uniref:Uncharacterized protein n=1 Tax=Rhizophagus irregularis (strain DAOM 181602 / DAOM 197198 / MUCL 43194) TaxID=747089 RepID=U9U5A9_RHIID